MYCTLCVHRERAAIVGGGGYNTRPWFVCSWQEGWLGTWHTCSARNKTTRAVSYQKFGVRCTTVPGAERRSRKGAQGNARQAPCQGNGAKAKAFLSRHSCQGILVKAILSNTVKHRCRPPYRLLIIPLLFWRRGWSGDIITRKRNPGAHSKSIQHPLKPPGVISYTVTNTSSSVHTKRRTVGQLSCG